MTVHIPPPAVDDLTQAVEHVRPHLARSLPIGERARNFWAGVKAARNTGAVDVIEREFIELAQQTGLIRDLGKEDVAHLLRWGLLNRNPFS